MNIPIDIPIVLPVNTNPMVGQIDMGLDVLGLLLMLGFVVACTVIGWKALRPSGRRPSEGRTALTRRDRRDRRDLDQAA